MTTDPPGLSGAKPPAPPGDVRYAARRAPLTVDHRHSADLRPTAMPARFPGRSADAIVAARDAECVCPSPEARVCSRGIRREMLQSPECACMPERASYARAIFVSSNWMIDPGPADGSAM